VVAALLTLFVQASPAPVALASLPTLVTSAPSGRAGSGTHAPAPLPLPSRAAGTPALFVLPAVPVDSRALDSLPPTPLPALTNAPAAEALVDGVLAVPVTVSKPAAARSVARPPVVRAAARPAKLWRQLRKGLTVRGAATWYFGTRGYAGIPHVAMPGARYLPRGRTAPRARVCAAGRCITVRVVDACGCHRGSGRARVVDMSTTALRRLGLDPARGVYRVRVTLLTP
jgi:hypothetical protein